MRTKADRLRHTLCFEVLGLIIVTPLAGWLLDREMIRVGVMSMIVTMTAMVCNYLFNLAFDHLLVRLGRPVHVRPPWLRALHAVAFEASLICITTPFIAWWLSISLFHALVADLSIALFYVLFAYLFNWAYDVIWPMPRAAEVVRVED